MHSSCLSGLQSRLRACGSETLASQCSRRVATPLHLSTMSTSPSITELFSTSSSSGRDCSTGAFRSGGGGAYSTEERRGGGGRGGRGRDDGGGRGAARGGRSGRGRGRSQGRSDGGQGRSSGRGRRNFSHEDDMRSIRTLQSLLSRVEGRAPIWVEERDLTTFKAAFNRAAKLGTQEGADAAVLTDVMDVLAATYLLLVPRLKTTFTCVGPLWACAKAGYWGGGLATAIISRMGVDDGWLVRLGNDLDQSNLWWSLAEAPEELRDSEAAKVVLALSAARVPDIAAEEIGPQACANILLGCAKLRYDAPAMVQHLAGVAVQAAGRMAEQEETSRPGVRAVGFDPQQLADVAWALAELGLPEQAVAVQAAAVKPAEVKAED